MEKLHVAAGQRYGCLQCGRSCRTEWEIPVTGATERRLLELRVVGAVRETPTGRALDCSDGCGFLQPDQLCAVHGQLGFEAKPAACRHYPYQLTRTPAGVFVGLTFSCTAVQQNHGRPLAEHESDLRELLAEGGALVKQIPLDGLPVHARWFTSWDDYAAWEQTLQRWAALWGSAAALRGAAAALAELLARQGEGARSPLPRPLSLQGAGGPLVWPDELDDELLAEVLPALGEPRIDAGAGNPLGLEEEAEIERFLEHLVFRKMLLAQPTLLDNLCLLAALPRFLRCAARTQGGSLPAALDLAEKALVYHSRGLRPTYRRAARRTLRWWSEQRSGGSDEGVHIDRTAQNARLHLSKQHVDTLQRR